ncbi:MAG: PilZ domain-containing protein [Deltaproteobacteria bacterium]|nr:PilZ domain-containing protein [Deltaproteobacteria bacterium]
MSSHDDRNLITAEQAPLERRDSPRVRVSATLKRSDDEDPLEATGLLSINGYYFETKTEGWAGAEVKAVLDMGKGEPLELEGVLSCPRKDHLGHYLLTISDLDFDIERILARYIDTESKADQLPVED